MDFEERLFDAVVGQFFLPQWVATTSYNPNTGQNEPMMAQLPSYAARVASDFFQAKQTQILEAVKDRIDLDEVADRLWERIRDDVVQRLAPTYSGIFTNHDKARQDLREEINKRIADELARRALEAMDEGVVP